MPHCEHPIRADRRASPARRCPRADARVATLKAAGVPAYVYGDESMLGGLNAFFLLTDTPEVYGLPANPKMPSRNLWPSSALSAAGAAVVGLLGLLSFRKDRMARNRASADERTSG